MTHRNPPARIRWDEAFDAWGVTSNTDPTDVVLTCNWDDAITLANNGRITPTRATFTPPDDIQMFHFTVRTHP